MSGGRPVRQPAVRRDVSGGDLRAVLPHGGTARGRGRYYPGSVYARISQSGKLGPGAAAEAVVVDDRGELQPDGTHQTDAAGDIERCCRGSASATRGQDQF